MKNKLLTMGLAAILASGCAKIPVVGKVYTDIWGNNGIDSYQYLEGNQRNFVFTFDQFEYYYNDSGKYLDLNNLNLDLENARKISERHYETISTTNISRGFTFGSGYTEKSSFVEGKISFDERWIRTQGFNYYYFKVGDKVFTSGEIK